MTHGALDSPLGVQLSGGPHAKAYRGVKWILPSPATSATCAGAGVMPAIPSLLAEVYAPRARGMHEPRRLSLVLRSVRSARARNAC